MKSHITILGLGPGSKDYLTISAIDKMKSADILYLRTEKHPVVEYIKDLGVKIESFDYVYEEKDSFDEVYQTIVEKLMDLAKEKSIVYAVPGNPFVAENTVNILLDEASKNDIELDIVPGVSFVDAIINLTKYDPVNGLKIVDAFQLDNQLEDSNSAVIITQVYDRYIASSIKLKLMELYDDEHQIAIIKGAGIPDVERIEYIPLYEMDRITWLDHLCSIFIYPCSNNKVKTKRFSDLLCIMDKLRSEDGCPWDKEQTHKSLRPYLLEECYEVLEALDEEDMFLLEEELGDLLLQIVFHSAIAEENGSFSIHNVIESINYKLVNRHPHVFGDNEINTSEEVLVKWDELKSKEKNEKTITESLRRIPKDLPGLMKSFKIQEKAAKVGFDWCNVEEAMHKVDEELNELKECVRASDGHGMEEELGDLLFSVVNVARLADIRPELALNKTIEKFIKRFNYMEVNSTENLKDLSLDDMNILWEEAKNKVNK